MKATLLSGLYDRELTSPAVRTKSIRKLYGSRSLIDDLDIVNELDGHTGCVNALSWSKTGNLLASGSDDQHINIHAYQPSNSEEHFKLTTTVATGHTQNIFSVKFMPGHGDRTVVSAAGDGEVRVFDLEYAGRTREATASSLYASEGRRRRGRNTLYNGVRYLSDGDTDARVYRSHGDRVKRIVTESSPHLFLTCSEDGEVRQWDLRQPSSAYPRPRGGRHASSDDGDVPPPLISYKRYGLDLNTISCSASQPHYIALGGAHLHCFLHDRRMTGRDRLQEAGRSSSKSPSSEDGAMHRATRCVRKFAPNGQQRMKRTENGHITACKISDARPDEMIVSWSGDHIYSFDLVRSPDADEATAPTDAELAGQSRRAKESRERKRKRKEVGSDSSLGTTDSSARTASRPRTGEGAALRVRYQNGQSEDIPITGSQWQDGLTEKQRDAQRIAKAVSRLRSSFFASFVDGEDTAQTAALGEAASIISDIDEAIRDWRYPMDPAPEQVAVQQGFRSIRESTRRFVQAAGTVARILGGRLQSASSGPSPLLGHFLSIEQRTSDLPLSQQEHFAYDFVRAIITFLESGVGRLIEEFTRPAEMVPTVKAARRLPIPYEDATVDAIDEHLIPYLLSLASERPIMNMQTNRFATDERQVLFPSEKAAVTAFQQMLRIPFADLSSAVAKTEGEGSIEAQDRESARKFWALKVARGVLLNAAEPLVFVAIDQAFGGVGRVVREIGAEGAELAGDPTQESEDDPAIENVEMLDADGNELDGAHAEDISAAAQEERVARRQAVVTDDDDENNDDDEHIDEDDDTHERTLADEDSDDEVSDDSSAPDEEDGVPNLRGLQGFMYGSAFERRRRKEKVEARVPCSASTRVYRGHCNVRTVKDCNYFGLDDEYVVSGSDDGNFFIWDRKTSELVNILEGDGEVVNVITGHPYENMMAVSGIDHTIKIFSPDNRARARARLGDGVTSHDPSGFSTAAFPPRYGRRTRRAPTSSEPAAAQTADEADEEEDYVAENGLKSRKRMQDSYRITSHNDVERRGGNQDAYITVRDLHPLLMLLARGERGFTLG